MEVSSLYKGQTVKKEKTGNKVVRQTVFYKKGNDYYDVLTLKKYTSKEEYTPYGGIYVDESSILQITEEDILLTKLVIYARMIMYKQIQKSHQSDRDKKYWGE